MTSSDRDPSAVEAPPEGVDDDTVGSPATVIEGPGERAESASGKTKRTSRFTWWQETALLVVIAVVVALVVKQFFLQPFYIPSESMEPGLVKSDRILVEKPSYWFGGEPERGDVVVFEDPGGWLGPEESEGPTNPFTTALSKIGLYPTGGHLVKRVIGVGGDTVSCCDKQGRVQVNGQPLEEPYARPGVRSGGGKRAGASCYGPMTGDCSWTAGPVPEGYLFVMGDNRARSADSTVHMCTDDVTDCAQSPYVPVDNVVGKVMALIWPPDRAHWTHRPETFEDVPEP